MGNVMVAAAVLLDFVGGAAVGVVIGHEVDTDK